MVAGVRNNFLNSSTAGLQRTFHRVAYLFYVWSIRIALVSGMLQTNAYRQHSCLAGFGKDAGIDDGRFANARATIHHGLDVILNAAEQEFYLFVATI